MQHDLQSADAVLNRLRNVFDLSTDAALAELLGVAPSTLGNWRRRNSVPYAECVRLAGEHFFNLHWLLTGQGDAGAWQSDVPVEIDAELLGIALYLSERWLEKQTNVHLMWRSVVIAERYRDIARRHKELRRTEQLDDRAALHVLQRAFEVPWAPEGEPPPEQPKRRPQ